MKHAGPAKHLSGTIARGADLLETPVRGVVSGRAFLLLICFALLATSLAAWESFRVFRRLPLGQLFSLRSDALGAAVRQYFKSADAAHSEAAVLAEISGNFASAWRHPDQTDHAEKQLSTLATRLSGSQFPRLQQAALRMLKMEREGQDPREWWPALEPYLSGLERGAFAHRQALLTELWTESNRTAGLSPGTAAAVANVQVGQPHGIFVQVFADRLARVATASEAAGDRAAAALCRTILLRWLRDWTLEEGAPYLQLLAADLLARELDRCGPGDLAASKVASELRAWRRGYRAAARKQLLSLLSMRAEPLAFPREHEAALRQLGGTATLLSAAIAAALVALLTGWSLLVGGAARPRLAPSLRAAMLIAVGVVVVAALVVTPAAVRDDLRGSWDSLKDGPRLPWVGAALAMAGCTLLPLLNRRPADAARDEGADPRTATSPSYGRRLAALATCAWLFLAVAALLHAAVAERAVGIYDATLARSPAEAFVAIAGEGANSRLEALRAWDPVSAAQAGRGDGE